MEEIADYWNEYPPVSDLLSSGPIRGIEILHVFDGSRNQQKAWQQEWPT
jgi:hypothetical protein